jgi:hypothetical protein
MQFVVPDVTPTLDRLMTVKSRFDGQTKPISQWVSEHRDEIQKNRELIEQKSSTNDIYILNIFLRDILVRAIRGEMGNRVHEQLDLRIQTKADLTRENYVEVLRKSKYRWGVDVGSQVMLAVVKFVEDELFWDWDRYLEDAERSREDNFKDDPMLRIKYVKFKLRDLALSNFSPHFAAFDLHVTRVLTRLGWLCYGFPLLQNSDLEMGNNPSNEKNYLFIHRLFVTLSEMTDGKYSPVDIDRIFWHLGKSLCGATTKCIQCPVARDCPTGRLRQGT